jgi:HAMP domain-containing protein
VLLTLLLLGAVGYLLTRNLGRLLRGSQAIAAGRLSHRLPEQGNDELAQLCQHFNRMAAALQSRIQELEAPPVSWPQRGTLCPRHPRRQRRPVGLGHPSNKTYFAPRFAEILGLPFNAFTEGQRSIIDYLHPDDRKPSACA